MAINPLVSINPLLHAPDDSKPTKPKHVSAKQKLDQVKKANERRKKAAEIAAAHLTLSSLHLDQTEGMGDIDIDTFKLRLGKSIGINISESLTQGSIQRTVEGASTLQVTMLDRDKKLLLSNRLHNRNDVELDGIYFRLVQVSKQGQYLTLTFEDREVAVLRRYDKPIRQSAATDRNKITRAQFIKRLIKEPLEYKPKGIPCVIPELKVVQPIDPSGAATGTSVNDKTTTKGVDSKSGVKVKTYPATATQLKIINEILDTGQALVMRRDILVMAIMTATQETGISNMVASTNPADYNWISAKPGDNPVGVFQQRRTCNITGFPGQPWPASRNVSKDAAAFYKAAGKLYVKGKSLGEMCDEVQIAGTPKAFAHWYNEADHTVSAWGVKGNGSRDLQAAVAAAIGSADSGSGGPYQFYRGVQPTNKGGKWKKETSWDCIQRLAQEVNWRAFMVSGTFYYISEADLLTQKPRAVIDEDTTGIDWIDFDFDVGKKHAEISVTCRIGRWAAPPGSVVMIQNMGIINGRWLVSSVERDLYKTSATITLLKPVPTLPEPAQSNVDQSQGDFQFSGFPKDDSSNGKFKASDLTTGTPKQIIDNMVVPLAKKHKMNTGIDPKAIVAANAVHGPTVNGTRSDHQGPPNERWASDMSNSGTNYRDKRDDTPEMRALADDIAKMFGIPWEGSGESSVIKGSQDKRWPHGKYRYQLLHDTLIGGNHYNHVHFGIRLDK